MSPVRYRLATCRRLRAEKAERWIVRSEQVALACIRQAFSRKPLAVSRIEYREALLKKYVLPIMEPRK